jgi:hypothetical protein
VDDVVVAEVDEVVAGADVAVDVEVAKDAAPPVVVGVSSTEESFAPAQAAASKLKASSGAMPRRISPPIPGVETMMADNRLRIDGGANSGPYAWYLDPRKSCNREGLQVPGNESRVAEILVQDHKATGKTGDDNQSDS